MTTTHADIIVHALGLLGESKVFQSPRSHSLGIAELITQHQHITEVTCLDEATATFAAYGYARAKPGSVGIATIVTHVAAFQIAEECNRDRVPMLLLVCAPDKSPWSFDHQKTQLSPHQTLAATKAMMPTVMYGKESHVYEAYNMAKTMRTCVTLWLNSKHLYTPTKHKMSPVVPEKALRVPSIKPDTNIAKKIVKSLSDAMRKKTPIALLVGDEIRNAPGTGKKLEKIISNMPFNVTEGRVFTTLTAKSALNEQGSGVRVLGAEEPFAPNVTVMLCLGVHWTPVNTYGHTLQFPKTLKRIYLNIKEWSRWPATMQLAKQQLKTMFEAQTAQPLTAIVPPNPVMTPVEFKSSTSPAISALAQHVSDQLVLSDIGTYTFDALVHLRLQRDRLICSHFRGTGLAYAIGTQIAQQGTHTICLVGDGALRENGIAAISTAAENDLTNWTVVVFNNQRHVLQSQMLMFVQPPQKFNAVSAWDMAQIIPAISPKVLYKPVDSEMGMQQALKDAQQDMEHIHVIGVNLMAGATNPTATQIASAMVQHGKKK